MKKFIPVLLLIILLLNGRAYADKVITKGGNIYNGKITSIQTEIIEITTPEGIFNLPTKNITRIDFEGSSTVNKSTKEELKQKTQESSAKKATDDNNEIINFKVPIGLRIPIKFSGSFNTKSVERGDRFEIKIARNVYVDDKLLFKKGEPCFAIIGEVRKPRGIEQKGEIEIESGVVYDIFNNDYPVRLCVYKEGEPTTNLLFIYGLLTNKDYILYKSLSSGAEAVVNQNLIFDAFITEGKTIKVPEKVLKMQQKIDKPYKSTEEDSQ